jgi:hypothetical protein
VDMNKLDQDGKHYVKTVRCIMGQTLFSDSWLEI